MLLIKWALTDAERRLSELFKSFWVLERNHMACDSLQRRDSIKTLHDRYDPNDRSTHNLECLSKRQLIALLCHREVRFDELDLSQWQRAIMSRMKILNARAREGKCVDEASEFARWIVQGGFLKLFHGPARMDMQTLQSDTLWACENAWKNSALGPAMVDVQSTQEKMDKLLCVFAKVAQKPEALKLLEDAAK